MAIFIFMFSSQACRFTFTLVFCGFNPLKHCTKKQKNHISKLNNQFFQSQTKSRIVPLPLFSTVVSVHDNSWIDDVSQVDDNHNDNVNRDNVVKADEEKKEYVKEENSSVDR